jgi:lipoprotein
LSGSKSFQELTIFVIVHFLVGCSSDGECG